MYHIMMCYEKQETVQSYSGGICDSGINALSDISRTMDLWGRCYNAPIPRPTVTIL